MDRLSDLWDAVVRAYRFCIYVIAMTIWVAVYGPLAVLSVLFLFYLAGLYVVTLVQSPSLIHLYIGLVFIAVLSYRIWFWNSRDEFDVRRGRQIRRIDPTERQIDLSRPRTSRSQIRRTTIQRGR